MKRIITTLLLLALGFTGFTQSTKYTIEELREDLKALKDGIEEFNPGLGHFHPREEFEEVYDSLYAAIDHEMTDIEFYPYLRRLGAATKEGHTLIGTNSDTVTNIFKGFFNGEFKYLPLSFMLDGDHYVATGNYSRNDDIQQGDIVESINGRSINDIIDVMAHYSIVDGHIDAVRRYKAIASFASSYFWFVQKPKHFEVEFTRKGKRLTTSIPAISLDSMRYYRNERYGTPEDRSPSINDVYTFEQNQSYAILTLKTFNRQQKEKYDINTRKLYKEIFSQLRDAGTPNLIIDIRNNSGGRTEYVEDLLPYILKEEKSGILKEAKSWKGKKIITRYPGRSKLVFDGQIYVLTNHNSYSAGSTLPMLAKEFGGAIIIGSETASRYEGFVAGSSSSVILPNIGLKCWIPRYITTYPDKLTGQTERNRGVLPDYPITYTYEEWKEKKDLEMEKALNLIEK